mmetsp:Transcript_72861/g.140942  ORF Transcript_72861/g.140942 Transcript_72861/m.140942 type:complete len:133 (-) Transcript_72861:7-405(-)
MMPTAGANDLKKALAFVAAHLGAPPAEAAAAYAIALPLFYQEVGAAAGDIQQEELFLALGQEVSLLVRVCNLQADRQEPPCSPSAPSHQLLYHWQCCPLMTAGMAGQMVAKSGFGVSAAAAWHRRSPYNAIP